MSSNIEDWRRRAFAASREVLRNRILVEWCRLEGLERDGSLRALAKACSETVAVRFIDEPSLAADYLDCALGAGSDALSAAVAPLLVDTDDLATWHETSAGKSVREAEVAP